MKSTLTIQKKGTMLHPKLANQFIEQILLEKGCKFSKHKNYELWVYPKDNPRYWYVLKGTTRKEVVREIKPTFINKYVNRSVEQLQQILEDKEQKLEQLQKEVIELRSKKKVKEIRSTQTNLTSFIQGKEGVSW